MISLLMSLACAPHSAEPEPTPAIAAGTPEDPFRVTTFTLANGLQVWVSEDASTPEVAARIMVRAGAAQEPAEASGLAHTLEHLLANKGTRRLGTLDYQAERPHLERIEGLYDQLSAAEDEQARAALYAEIDAEARLANRYAVANELKQAYGALGARGLNAFTSQDRTVYVVELPSNRLEQWAALEADRFSEPVFRGFHTEVEAIYEEKNRAMDRPRYPVNRAVEDMIWPGHPYTVGVLGSVEHLKRPSISRTRAFFETWVVPNNMALFLAGDVTPEQARALAERAFGALEPKPLPEWRSPLPPMAEGPRRREVTHHGQEEVRLAWRAPPRSHPDAEALILADRLLNNGAAGLLDEALNQAQRVRASGSKLRLRRQTGAAEVWGRPKAGQRLEEVEALLVEQVQALIEGRFEEATLDAIALELWVQEREALESNAARAERMMLASLHELPWARVRDLAQRIGGLTRAEVIRVAAQVYGGPMAVALRRRGDPEIPEITAPPITPLTVNTTEHSALYEEVLAMEAPPMEPQVLEEGQDFRRLEEGGRRLVLEPNPYDHGLAQLTLRVERGWVDDPALCPALGLWSLSGAGERDLEAVERALYHMGVELSTSCGRRVTDLTLAGPERSLGSALELLGDRLRSPTLPEEQRRRWAEDEVARRRQALETRDGHVEALRSYALHGEGSPSLTRVLPDEALLSRSVEQWMGSVGALLEAPWVALYAGAASPEQVLELLEELPTPTGLAPQRAPWTFAPVEQPRVLLLTHRSVQASVTATRPAGVWDARQVALHRLYQEHMGGSAGVVFQEIREARGYAYAAGARFIEGSRVGDQGYARGALSCQAEKADEAAALLLELMRQPALPPERWDRIRTAAVEKQRASRVGFRRVGPTVEAWRQLGLEEDPRPQRLAAMEAATREELLAFEAELGAGPWTLAVVGDPERLDLEALEALAPLMELSIEELVAY